MGGCGPRHFCPEELVLREDMAVHLEKYLQGPSYTPAPLPLRTPRFADVPRTYGFVGWIEKLAGDEITRGCVPQPTPTPGLYCPYGHVTRWEMALFLSRAVAKKLGESVPTCGIVGGQPYACGEGGVSLFGDVPPGDEACPAVHYIYYKGVTTGCQPSPRMYCPSDYVTRAQMAVFLKRAFVGTD